MSKQSSQAAAVDRQSKEEQQILENKSKTMNSTLPIAPKKSLEDSEAVANQ